MSEIAGEINSEMIKEVKSNRAWRLECEQLRADNARLIEELNEHARLLGISAEKELALRAENERLKAELKSIDGALDDPRANLTLTTAEIIWEIKAELAEAKKDAERYRWLRNNPVWVGYDSDFRPDEIDAAIDAAMKGK